MLAAAVAVAVAMEVAGVTVSVTAMVRMAEANRLLLVATTSVARQQRGTIVQATEQQLSVSERRRTTMTTRSTESRTSS